MTINVQNIKLDICPQCGGLTYYEDIFTDFMTCGQCGYLLFFDGVTEDFTIQCEGHGMAVFILNSDVYASFNLDSENIKDENLQELISNINGGYCYTENLHENSNIEEYLRLFDFCVAEGVLLEEYSYISKATSREVMYLRGGVECFHANVTAGCFDYHKCSLSS